MNMNQPLFNEHEEKLNQIQKRVTELKNIRIKNLVDNMNKMIDTGKLDEEIALAISQGENEYCIFQNKDKTIQYHVIFANVIKRLKSLYHPTYKINHGYLMTGHYYILIFNLKQHHCILF